METRWSVKTKMTESIVNCQNNTIQTIEAYRSINSQALKANDDRNHESIQKKNVVQDIVTYLLIIKHTTFSQSAYSYDILHNKVKIPKGNIYIYSGKMIRQKKTHTNHTTVGAERNR